MPVFRLAPIDIRARDEKWEASTIKEAVWVEAIDELAARHLIERATFKMIEVKAEQRMIYSPWVDDVVTICWPDQDVPAPPLGTLKA